MSYEQTATAVPGVLRRRLALWLDALAKRIALRPDDLLLDATYRRLWTSILISSFGGQVTMLALPLTAAVLLHATPTQMGLLTAMEIAPFVLLSLPAGVWLDRVRKLPVYVVGEAGIALVVASVPLAWWLGWLDMAWMYAAAFVMGCIYVTAGSAAQIVLTQVVARERLVEAHAKNALATSGAEVAGPGLAGALIKLVGAPLALPLTAGVLLQAKPTQMGLLTAIELLPFLLFSLPSLVFQPKWRILWKPNDRSFGTFWTVINCLMSPGRWVSPRKPKPNCKPITASRI